MVSQILTRSRRSEPLAGLTPREREVLALMAQGLSNAGIADELTVSEGAVEKHISGIFGKLDLPAADGGTAGCSPCSGTWRRDDVRARDDREHPGRAGPPPVRRGALVCAVLFVVVMVTAGTVNIIEELVEATFEQSTTIVPSGRALSVEADNGDIDVGPSPDGNVHVRTTVEYGLTRPRLIEQANAEEVLLRSECDGVIAVECQVDYDVLVPAGFPVYAETTAGDVQLTGLTGPLTVRTATGEVTLSGVAGTVDARAQAGRIRGSELRSPSITARSASGNIDLELLVAPQLVDAIALGGDADVLVPGDARYRVTAQAPYGEQVVAVPTDPASANTITAQTSAGMVRVRPR